MGAAYLVTFPTHMDVDPLEVLKILQDLIAEALADDTKTVKVRELKVFPGIGKIDLQNRTCKFLMLHDR